MLLNVFLPSSMLHWCSQGFGCRLPRNTLALKSKMPQMTVFQIILLLFTHLPQRHKAIKVTIQKDVPGWPIQKVRQIHTETLYKTVWEFLWKLSEMFLEEVFKAITNDKIADYRKGQFAFFFIFNSSYGLSSSPRIGKSLWKIL